MKGCTGELAGAAGQRLRIVAHGEMEPPEFRELFVGARQRSYELLYAKGYVEHHVVPDYGLLGILEELDHPGEAKLFLIELVDFYPLIVGQRILIKETQAGLLISVAACCLRCPRPA